MTSSRSWPSRLNCCVSSLALAKYRYLNHCWLFFFFLLVGLTILSYFHLEKTSRVAELSKARPFTATARLNLPARPNLPNTLYIEIYYISLSVPHVQHAFERGKYTSEGVFPHMQHSFEQDKYTSVYKILLSTPVSTPLALHDFRTGEMYIPFHSANDTLLSSPLRKHALERGKQIFISVSLGQHALERGKHTCAFCSTFGQQALERGKCIMLSVFLGRLILLGQHAFETKEMYIAFCETWVTLVSNWSAIINHDFRTRKMTLCCFSSTW